MPPKNVIITATPPTPNGDLHVGHLSGPYLNADVMARYRRQLGDSVTFVTGTDANQNYVVSSAKSRGKEPQEMADHFAGEIKASLDASQISYDVFMPPDARHIEVVHEFYLRLHSCGELVFKKQPALWSTKQNQVVSFSFVSGYCPNCFAETAESVCEACAHPIGPDTILQPYNPFDRDDLLTLNEVECWVFELETRREKLRSFYSDKQGVWRPHVLELVEQMLAKPLPDFVITMSADWGVPSPLPGSDGQVLTGWAELLPGAIRATEAGPHSSGSGISDWKANENTELLQFMGYDNSYFYAVPHVLLALALNPEIETPTALISNEFYQLEGFKFSTSKNNVIWVRDALKTWPADALRLYLCLDNPEKQKGNFFETAATTVIGKRVVEPLTQICCGLNKATGNAIPTAELISAHKLVLDQLYHSTEYYLSVRHYSVQLAAEVLCNFWDWMVAEINRAERSKDALTLQSLALLFDCHLPVMSLFAPGLAQSLAPKKQVVSWRQQTVGSRTEALSLAVIEQIQSSMDLRKLLAMATS